MTITIIPRVVIYVVNYSEERKKKESGVLDTGPFRVSRFRDFAGQLKYGWKLQVEFVLQCILAGIPILQLASP
jgi:hypothetical protein